MVEDLFYAFLYLFDGVQVGGVWRKVCECYAERSGGFFCFVGFVGGEVVEYYDDVVIRI